MRLAEVGKKHPQKAPSHQRAGLTPPLQADFLLDPAGLGRGEHGVRCTAFFGGEQGEPGGAHLIGHAHQCVLERRALGSAQAGPDEVSAVPRSAIAPVIRILIHPLIYPFV